MMRALLVLMAAAAPVWAVYLPYESNPLTSTPANWQMAGSLQFGSTGATASGTSGTLVYTAGAGSAEEVRLDITLAAAGGTYTAYFLAGTNDLATANLYCLTVNNITMDATGCWAATTFGKRVNGVSYDLDGFTQTCRVNGQNRFTLRGYVRPGMQLWWAGPNSAYPTFDNDPAIQGGRSGMGLANTPAGNSVTLARLFHGESVAPPAPERPSFAVSPYPNRVEMQCEKGD